MSPASESNFTYWACIKFWILVPEHNRHLGAFSASQLSNAPRHGFGAFASSYTTNCAVIVRDRGRGFDPETVADDRKGISISIIDRHPSRRERRSPLRARERHGGAIVGPDVSDHDPRIRVLLVDDHTMFRGGAKAELFISVKTVETHASNVLRKTQQSNRNALTSWARNHKI